MPHDGAVTSTLSPNFLEFEPTRHQRWYERILLSTPLGYVLSLVLVVLVPFYLAYGYWDPPADPNQLLTLFILGGGFIVNSLLSRALTQYPGAI
ncbi:hypothetical protein HML84_05960 [Alcanivorax sp. IO_7]|nr:hypothetical protein HML84_05960 [Alcanivorax sp. IO_7]